MICDLFTAIFSIDIIMKIMVYYVGGKISIQIIAIQFKKKKLLQ